MAVEVLTPAQRYKLDGEDDAVFYRDPRFVHHLDEAFRARLTALYREQIPPCATVLDLMSSWVSHLPDEIRYERVIGHGLNAQELAANPRSIATGCKTSISTRPCPGLMTFDATLIVAGWQYLQYPEAIAAELLRITARRTGSVVLQSDVLHQGAPDLDGLR